jgi:hypothetical protein
MRWAAALPTFVPERTQLLALREGHERLMRRAERNELGGAARKSRIERYRGGEIGQRTTRS